MVLKIVVGQTKFDQLMKLSLQTSLLMTVMSKNGWSKYGSNYYQLQLYTNTAMATESLSLVEINKISILIAASKQTRRNEKVCFSSW